ncbi:MAG: zinc ribbon domain-containing protein [Candidatus Kariarchaeaceae archaeon]|jgi:hypothetical protein
MGKISQMEIKCDTCNTVVQPTWRYCRYCGKSLPKRDSPVEEEAQQDVLTEKIETKREEVSFNKDLYFQVLSTRSHRSELINQKKELLQSVNSLLEQVQSGLITRDYAVPKIKELKEKVTSISTEEKEYEGIPEKLPLEVLLDEIDAAQTRLRKIDDLKSDPAISKEAIKDAKMQSENSLRLLKEQQSMVNGHLRNWQVDLKRDLDKNRKELEQLYIRVKTGEITEETYEERKQTKSKMITATDGVLQLILQMLDH